MGRIRMNGGETTGKGHYWNLKNGHSVHFNAEGQLPGSDSDHYYKLPVIMVIMAGPVIGLAYAIFLPFIGIAMTLTLLAKKLAGAVQQLTQRVVVFPWAPSEAYLAGKKKEDDKKTGTQNDPGK